ncbi:phenylacetic acid degradation protein [Fulvitalea axinellae]|uniref:Phenylacetic acid degradation protein n=1 Tax=Fulvitalea axinellae TaxID=1182444 RepID=A0AAU9CK67_9BACT|nr:phenylacetic acid degradation protein [Fulvitalea axinellae]
MATHFHKLRVADVQPATCEAVTVSFDIPEEIKSDFCFLPGQHLTFRFLIDNTEHRRSYSLNSNPFGTEAPSVTVKRVKKGIVSNFINDNLKPGDTVEATLPLGSFKAEIQPDEYKTYFLIAAGSGITPIMSILRSALHQSKTNTINLFYGNKDQDSIIFEKELEKLRLNHLDRLKVCHTLSSPKVWSSWKQWEGKKGRIDAKSLEAFINEHPPIAQSTEYFVCGPEAMNLCVRDTLLSLGVPSEQIKIEMFGHSDSNLDKTVTPVDNAELEASLDGKTIKTEVKSGNTILRSLLDSGADVPYSCESGVCGTCTATLVNGKTEMKSCFALTEEEIKNGAILTCQAYPVSEKVKIDFDK